MNKIYKLNQKLDNLESQKNRFSSFENISIFQFIKYKKILYTEAKTIKKLYKLNLLKREVNFLYDINTKSWIANPKINCRQYYKLEQKAAYKKDLTLYHLGILEKRPHSLLRQNFSQLITPITERFNETFPNFKKDLSRVNFFKFIYNKYIFFTSNTLPKKINNLALNTAKICIKGYKKLQTDCKYVRNSLESTNSFKYFQSIISEANRQISRTEKEKIFRDSLKVDNYNLSLEKNSHSFNKSPINKKIMRNTFPKEYTL